MRAPLLATAVAFLLIYPAVAQEISASIDFHASVAGSNVLHPGDKTAVTILLSCEGKLDNFPINENTSETIPMLTTAKSVVLEPIDSNIRVESDTVLVGDLPCGIVRPVNLVVEVDKNAYEGKHELHFDVEYSQIELFYDIVNDTYSMKNSPTKEDRIDVEFEIKKKEYDFNVISITSDLVAGREGVLKVKLENTGEKA
ncbi:hypothetical protein, partial [Archaeoglobus sp.]|uniref:hypothetical protein n=1 Tax=Archaeoglobus sp. TaxID=1872626 RepID=UPI0024AA3591